MKKVLGKDAIVAVKDLETKRVSVSEWGGDVLVRSMSAGERLEFENAIKEGDGLDPIVNFVAITLVDEAGNRLFSADEVEALKAKSCKALMSVFDAASKLNAFTAQDAEDLAKNSEAAPGGDSPSA